MSDLSYAELTDVLARLAYPDSAANFHGTVCGSLCVQEPEEIELDEVLDAAQEGLRGDEDANAIFLRLRLQAVQGLISPEMNFAPLLPEDDTPLPERVQALASWCEGFLFGLASRRSLDLRSSSEEAREMIRDLTRFTQADNETGGDPETEETAYSELVEYVRIGAQLLFMEFHPRSPPAADAQTLH